MHLKMTKRRVYKSELAEVKMGMPPCKVKGAEPDSKVIGRAKRQHQQT